MNRYLLAALVAGTPLAALVPGCGTTPDGDDQLDIGTVEQAAKWVPNQFKQVLRIAAGEKLVRHRCSLTLPSAGSTPYAFTVTADAGLTSISLGWNGTTVSQDGFKVTDCGTGCVVATYRETGAPGEFFECRIEADDGNSTTIGGETTGAAIYLGDVQSADVIYHQHVRTEVNQKNLSTACIFRANAVLPKAQFSDFGFFVNGTKEAAMLGPEPIGADPWWTDGPAVAMGKLVLGADSTSIKPTTRFKHIAARKEQLATGDYVHCAGSFDGGSIDSKDAGSVARTVAFDVNNQVTRTGNGMTMGTAARTSWSCDPALFADGSDCDCNCGTVDPDCGYECTTFTMTASGSSDWLVDGNPDPTLDLYKGRTYVFQNQTKGHPLAIHHTTGGSLDTTLTYTDGVVQTQPVVGGPLQFTVPVTAPSTLFYQCESHIGMWGQLNIL